MVVVVVGPITHQGGADKSSHRANTRYSTCLHRLVCYRTDDIQNSLTLTTAQFEIKSKMMIE